MPLNTSGVLTPRQDLLGAYMGYDMDGIRLGASFLYPPFTVAKDKGDFGVLPSKVMSTIPGGLDRAPKTRRSRSDHGWQADSWELKEKSHEQPVDETDADMLGDWFAAEEVAAMRLRHIIDMGWEEVAADTVNQTAFPASGNTGHNASATWNASGGLPLTDVNLAKLVKLEQGVRVNAMLITEAARIGMGTNPQILDRIKHRTGSIPVEGSVLTDADLSALFELEVMSVNAYANTANPAKAESLSSLWNSALAIVFKRSTGPLNVAKQFGRTFTRETGADAMTYSYAEPQTDSNVIVAKAKKQLKQLDTACAYVIGNVYA